jgi:hypothetical protein
MMDRRTGVQITNGAGREGGGGEFHSLGLRGGGAPEIGSQLASGMPLVWRLTKGSDIEAVNR